MIRRVAAVLLALTLNPALLHAQGTSLTITVQSADVHQGPSTASPIIGHASRDTALAVSRNLGSWVRVVWPDAADGVAYVHMTMGRLSAATVNAPATSTSSRAVSAPMSTAVSAPPAPAQRTPAPVPIGDRVPPPSAEQSGTKISHIVGVGAMVGSMSSWGATTRVWHKKHLGFQVGVTRDAMTSDTATGRVTTMQVEPGVVYALFDRVRDYVWVRPYVGSGVNFRHQTLKDEGPAPMALASDNGVGFRMFGGSELTFATVTQLGLSAEFGYQKLPTAFPGFEPDRFSFSILGHWYIK